MGGCIISRSLDDASERKVMANLQCTDFTEVLIFIIECIYYLNSSTNILASVVQWLGFIPSKDEVRVRFTAVALM